MALLRAAHDDVGGDVTSAGGTGTYDLHDWVAEVQAGSYLLMDTAYARLALPFEQAVFVAATVISVSPRHAVGDAGLKSFGMDHGEPSIDGYDVFFTSDEHVTFTWADGDGPAVGDRLTMRPAHVDPTVAYHERIWVVDTRDPDGGGEVVDAWPVDLRNW
jgi:D-serine deaminase-like pyridoxal phosphate-dependent protein